ncbi:hypothetical protein SSS_07873 [Sarcoptes scabiei]|uniref:Spaetzle domain-containing protein n=1 Tax=Sarcoptes scabiei TaxID=52283 RepID=A0A131ZWT5_SARSC|nr:hypothetical protein SSS_07873 [Sarcoptes scabiei]KPM02570.1 hypothetical protein QR98_0009850 [Sarcoptes scabiei]UXI20450.1 Cytoplasmic protein NCK2 [Sarcoptes scabiei]
MKKFCLIDFGTLVSIFFFKVSYLNVIYSQSCGPRISPRLLADMPCDLSKEIYCAQPGSAYPWDAVRRFIFDNHGLVKKMYGEQRESQIIQEEIKRIGRRYRQVFDAIDRNDPPLNELNENRDNRVDDESMPEKNGLRYFSFETNEKNLSETNATILNSPEENDGYSTTTGEMLLDQIDRIDVVANTQKQIQEEKRLIINDDAVSNGNVDENNESVQDNEIKGKGYNACPITQEVVAPYWANNTRGETLALLNVYPFEQYIHWEKCSFEGEQMFCRDSCRCEQQYRLHRLLAFDPKNECRGIFADWFRFPGCCVCICYDGHERINNRKSRL